MVCSPVSQGLGSSCQGVHVLGASPGCGHAGNVAPGAEESLGAQSTLAGAIRLGTSDGVLASRALQSAGRKKCSSLSAERSSEAGIR